MEDSLYNLCCKALAREASPEELAQLQAWKQASPANQAEFDAVAALWASASRPAFSFDKEAAWARVSAATGIAAPQRRTISLRWLSASVAGVAAAVVVGFFLLRPSAPDAVSVLASANQEVSLPDGSVVSLRKGSSLSYSRDFEGPQRIVRLRGEAFFKVARNERKPFIVQAPEVQVQVLGTSFNVAGNDSGAVVSVASGEVRVTSADHPSKAVVLHKGEEASLVHDHLSSQNISSDNYLYWKTGKLHFKDQPLRSVLQDLSKASGKPIRLDDASGNSGDQRVTIGFEQESLEEMLTELGLITHTGWKAGREGYIIRAQ